MSAEATELRLRAVARAGTPGLEPLAAPLAAVFRDREDPSHSACTRLEASPRHAKTIQCDCCIVELMMIHCDCITRGGWTNGTT